jgi:hypothetical protein
MKTIRWLAVTSALLVLGWPGGSLARAAKLSVEIPNAEQVTFVGALQRWDQDGNARKTVNPKQKIEAPEVDAAATKGDGGQWVFKDLSPGTYDLVILAGPRVRIEGFNFPPVLEFDPFLPGTATADHQTRQFVINDIKKSPHYENKVLPLYVGQGKGENQPVRVLVMLVRDNLTSYEAEFPGAATIRHEVWQYTWRYGGWAKERRTRVFDRVILHRDELRKWTWLWDPKLGGIEVARSPVKIRYTLPGRSEKKLPGLYPY